MKGMRLWQQIFGDLTSKFGHSSHLMYHKQDLDLVAGWLEQEEDKSWYSTQNGDTVIPSGKLT